MDERQRADFARQVLDNPVFQHAFAEVTDSLASARATAKWTDTETHSRLIIAEQLLIQFERVFTRAIADGDVAAMRVKETKFPVFRR